MRLRRITGKEFPGKRIRIYNDNHISSRNWDFQAINSKSSMQCDTVYRYICVTWSVT